MKSETVVGATQTIFKIKRLIVPIFEDNGKFMLGVLFFIQSIFGNRNNSFYHKILLHSIEEFDSLKSNVK